MKRKPKHTLALRYLLRLDTIEKNEKMTDPVTPKVYIHTTLLLEGDHMNFDANHQFLLTKILGKVQVSLRATHSLGCWLVYGQNVDYEFLM